MELRVLQYFLAIAREESITGAAELLHVTQPTLSRQMKDLEEELGKQLFLRGNRRITLTEDGMLLRKRAEEIMNLVDKTEAELHASETLISGDIYIGGGETEGMRIIARAIHKTQVEHPLIKFHLFSGNAADVTDRLDKGLLDFGILIEPAHFAKYDFVKLPTTDTWGLLMRNDTELAKKDNIEPDDIKGLPIICSNQEMVENEISEWLGTNFSELNIVSTYNLIYNASLMVEEGIGYALTLDKLINTKCHSTLCFKPLSPKLEVGLAIVWKKYQVFSKATICFFHHFYEEIRIANEQPE